MASAIPHEPMLVIIGATGTGKSKVSQPYSHSSPFAYCYSQLAVELATRFNGEIINGDAMQMYKGLPIITNKIPEHERRGIPHHLIDFIDFEEEPWTVTHFVREAQKAVQEIRSRGKLPILVGGTHYYTQSLLFRDSLVNTPANQDASKTEQDETEWPILSASMEEIYAQLEEVDPVMAKRWHPKDRRRVQRSLEIWLQTGRKASDVYQDQVDLKRSSSPGCEDNGSEMEEVLTPCEHLRYPSVIFWLHAQDDVLKARLNDRVHAMVASGLFEEAFEMSNFYTQQLSNARTLDLDKGIWVSIGYKEILPYIAAFRTGGYSQDELSRIRDECVDAVMAKTRRYAKRQIRQIRLTFMDFLAKASSLDRLFLLDCTDLDRWTEMVSEPGERIADAFLTNRCLPEPGSLSELASAVLASARAKPGIAEVFARRCTMCDRLMMTEHEWNAHLKSSGHKKVIEGQRLRAGNERRRQAAATARLEAAGKVAVQNGDLISDHVE